MLVSGIQVLLNWWVILKTIINGWSLFSWEISYLKVDGWSVCYQ